MRPNKKLDKKLKFTPKQKSSLTISCSKNSRQIIPKKRDKNNDLKKEKIDEIISNLENNGAAGLFHLSFVSKAIKRSIRVSKYKKPPLYVIWNNESNSSFIDVEYHKRGRWTRKNEKYPKTKKIINYNDCLFDAISLKINKTPQEIRNMTINEMKNNRNSVEKQLEIFDKIKYENSSSLMFGKIKSSQMKKDKEIKKENVKNNLL
ncbi:uncharacterized protein LOC127277041 isoform X1 [Leptopilina boulardi]|uniref:uncharacterized protein LOC127277041 isoform X1 n=1 Tax=Leptopilina boulardi TaxID=63433 RepID=UPI0021F65609|nr:uncharacterized protein LOC127277041 isoform X1 [Leptopilina boulardi]XP_051153807.1 uncharacterized protein LOC127277041 isoform X1 [Leptopilina boulardi]XP_051153808.1 uncharacterized protein LOC127277041 isoform X1 [Leptopilina boulardi]